MSSDSQIIMNSLRLIFRAARLSSRAAEKRLGISGAQLFVLQSLNEGQVLSLSEVAARTSTDVSSVSVVVARLVEKGLVQRVRARDDARRLELTLSAKGGRLLGKAPVTPQERLVAALAKMPARRRLGLRRALEALIDEAGLADEAAGMFLEDETRHPTSSRTKKTGSSRASSR